MDKKNKAVVPSDMKSLIASLPGKDYKKDLVHIFEFKRKYEQERYRKGKDFISSLLEACYVVDRLHGTSIDADLRSSASGVVYGFLRKLREDEIQQFHEASKFDSGDNFLIKQFRLEKGLSPVGILCKMLV